MEGIVRLLSDLSALAKDLDVPTLFAILTVEEAGIYLPLPGNWLMAYAGLRVAEGTATWYTVLAAGVLATVLGSCVLYFAARRGGRPLLNRFGPALGLTLARQVRVEDGLARHGLLAVYVGRLIPGFRCGSSFVAGLFGIPFASFIVATTAAAATWWGFWLYLGWRFGSPILAQLDASAGDLLLFGAALSMLSSVAIGLRSTWLRSRSASAR